jgi:hypothetical protein
MGSQVNALAIDGSQRIVVGTNSGLKRLTSAGATDSTFNTNAAAVVGTAAVNAVAVQTTVSNRILIGASATTKYFLGLTATGTADTTFNTNIGSANNTNIPRSPNVISVGSNGDIYVGGSSSDIKIKKFSSSGVVASSFNANSGPLIGSTVYAIEIQSDGKVLVGGAGSMARAQTGQMSCPKHSRVFACLSAAIGCAG